MQQVTFKNMPDPAKIRDMTQQKLKTSQQGINTNK